MIGLGGQFAYRVTLTRAAEGFSGTALPPRFDGHPGTVGQEPLIELRGGTIVLQRTQPDRLAAAEDDAKSDYLETAVSIWLSWRRALRSHRRSMARTGRGPAS